MNIFSARPLDEDAMYQMIRSLAFCGVWRDFDVWCPTYQEARLGIFQDGIHTFTVKFEGTQRDRECSTIYDFFRVIDTHTLHVEEVSPSKLAKLVEGRLDASSTELRNFYRTVFDTAKKEAMG